MASASGTGGPAQTAAPPEVVTICQQLVQAARLVMSPTAPKEQRIEAFHKCEDFKRSSPVAVQCGMALASDNDTIIRHFGLKIMEDVIKLRWNEMEPGQKLFLKESSMQLMESGTGDLLSEAPHIKDGISRLVVEIVKREWPQHWPQLFSELEALCARGETQTEMAMLVLLRLVEDVALLQTLEQTQRRKEIYQALTANMDTIFAFLLQLLEQQYQAYLAAGSTPEAQQRHCKVCRAVLDTFTAFVDWVAISHIMANDRYLVRCLCHLLSDPRLQMNAAACLLGIVSWKAGKPSDRMNLMSMFRTDMMAPLFEAAEKANGQALSAGEEQYHFLKRIVQVLAELGGQLCALWTVADKGAGQTLWEKEMPGGRPENFEIYLNALLAFLDHPSQAVSMTVAEVWVKLLRHADISKDPVFSTYIPKYVAIAVRRCPKLGSPSSDDHPSCQYSLMDFDTEEEFSAFFGRFRIILLEGIKLVKANNPSLPYQHAEVLLKKILATQQHQQLQESKKRTCLELDAIALILDAVFSKLDDSQMDQVAGPAAELARLCLAHQSPDSGVMSSMLSCISSLFPVIGRTHESPLLMPALEKIFSYIVYRGGPASCATGASLPEEVKMLRRHACALMVKLATRQASTLLPLFPQLRDKVQELRASGQVANMEYCTLVEALVLVSNEYRRYETQLEFLRLVMEPVWKQLTEVEGAIQSSASFAKFIGLGTPCPAGPHDDPFGDNRAKVSFCLTFVLSVCRRSCVPDDLSSCQAGGFVAAANGTFVSLRNPAWPVVSPFLRLVFALAATMNGLWAAAVRNSFHPDYSKVLDLMESEKVTITGSGSREERETAAQAAPRIGRTQFFIFEVYENVYHLLSECASSCGADFYATPGLSAGVAESVLGQVSLVPDFRLRSIIRMFLKQLIQKCPRGCYSSVLAPVLQTVCPYMLERLTARWEHLKLARESPSFDEDNVESREVMDDVICRHLAREYLDVIKALLTGGGGSDVSTSSFNSRSAGSSNGGNNHSEGDSQGGGGAANNPGGRLIMSELGALVLQHESLAQCVTMTTLQALLWPDSPSSTRAGVLLELILPDLLRSGQLGDAGADQVMVNLLSAINQLGQHELNYIQLVQLAIQAYEWMRPHHPSVVEVLAQVPGCNRDDLKRFDDRMMASIRSGGKEGVKGGERAKKDMFKKLIGQFIGRDVANMFRHEVVIKNLPTLQLLRPERKKTPGLLDDSPSGEKLVQSDAGLGKLFQQQNGGSS